MRTRIVLKEKNLPFDRILLDLPNKEQKQEWYLALNPYGKVPVLVEEGAWVYESALCNEYLEEKYPTPALAPQDAGAKAQMRLWVDSLSHGTRSTAAAGTRGTAIHGCSLTSGGMSDGRLR